MRLHAIFGASIQPNMGKPRMAEHWERMKNVASQWELWKIQTKHQNGKAAIAIIHKYILAAMSIIIIIIVIIVSGWWLRCCRRRRPRFIYLLSRILMWRWSIWCRCHRCEIMSMIMKRDKNKTNIHFMLAIRRFREREHECMRTSKSIILIMWMGWKLSLID